MTVRPNENHRWGGVVGVVAAADASQAEALRAITRYRSLACETFDLDAVRSFSAKWFADLQAGEVP